MVVSTREAVIQLGLMFQEGYCLSLKMIEERFNVSSRTAHRYIATLKSEYNAPIECDNTKHIYSCSTSWSIIEELKR